jgi:hypothetical protein
MTLSEAVAERVRALARANERLQALADQTADHVVQTADADVVLRQALDVLTAPEAMDSARRLLRGEDVPVGEGMSRTGLVSWDPASNGMRPTALLVEVMKVVDS